jgi:malonyl-CoA O-methyltransferase
MVRPAIRRSFDRAAASYDSAATLQRQVCELLLASLPDGAPATVLDAGCGTGYALGLLANRWPEARLTAADFAPAMLATAGGGVCADIESLPFAAACFDLYWSSLTLQWCDLGRAIAEAARTLVPGGKLAVSSLGPGTLTELRAAFSGTDTHRHVLDFAPAETLASACAMAGLDGIAWTTHSLRLHHANVTALLRNLKALGANQVGRNRRRGLLGRKSWQSVEERYENCREPAGLPATYEVILCTANKPTS